MQIYDVDVEPIKNDTAQQLSDTFYRNCNFCNKIVFINPSNLKSCHYLSGSNFFCSFCLRNNFHHKLSKNILIMSYRGIIGYYYWDLYQASNKIWYSDIVSLIEHHSLVGLENPVFHYDPSTYLWFLDFNRIGVGKKKAPISEVKKTAMSIMCAFNINKHVLPSCEDKMWDKYDEAIDIFYKQRKRPKDKKILIPTFSGIAGHHQKDCFWETTRNFVPASLILK